MLIVGTRGRSLGGLQGLLPGSVSKYCLQHSPVPVIVVRPTYKRERKKKKRQADPNRKNYLDILMRSGTKGVSAVDQLSSISMDDTPVATDNEAEAVAEAIGLPPAHDHTAGMSALGKVQSVQSTRSDATSYESPSPTEELLYDDDPKSPGMVMKSPGLGNMESPAASDSESSTDDSDGNRSKVEVTSGLALTNQASSGVDTKTTEAEAGKAADRAGGSTVEPSPTSPTLASTRNNT